MLDGEVLDVGVRVDRLGGLQQAHFLEMLHKRQLLRPRLLDLVHQGLLPLRDLTEVLPQLL